MLLGRVAVASVNAGTGYTPRWDHIAVRSVKGGLAWAEKPGKRTVNRARKCWMMSVRTVWWTTLSVGAIGCGLLITLAYQFPKVTQRITKGTSRGDNKSVRRWGAWQVARTK